jgi:arginyl-tRNA synthetase
MYRTFQQYLKRSIDAVLKAKYGITIDRMAIEQPPDIALGEFALPIAFELAKQLRKAPRVIAEEIKAELVGLQGIATVEVAGAGYLNIKLDRATFVRGIATQDKGVQIGGVYNVPLRDLSFYLVEHTSINPNKAAHIGHLRNAILGDTFVLMLKSRGAIVGVQNYIDNTGVQVADVVVGLVHLEGKTLDATRALMAELAAAGERIDFYCWDLYARVSQWYKVPQETGEYARRQKVRLDILHGIEHGGDETAAIAELISTAVLRRHLETMQRLGIEYDFLPRESEILSLHFWDAARTLMLERGVLYEETAGKNKGCLVMRRAGPAQEIAVEDSSLPDEDAKVIVRSNGTVTYVGKDIAYHLWKFGLLPGKDFGYARFHEYPTHTCWISTAGASDPAAPTFGRADAIYNVIDSRQNDPQNNVIAALRGMGFTEAADHYTHFSYEMVAMTPRCAEELGYTLSDEDKARPFVEVSGRKGYGVKADDLLDKLTAAAQAEVDARHPEIGVEERARIATQIAVGALRYFMLRFTRNTVIAFDFKDALSFEGETGPYIQYAIVRAANIFRKAETTEEDALAAVAGLDLSALAGVEGTSLWETWLLAARLTTLIEQAIATAEPAHLARYAFQLAQQFNNFYHRYHILTETDATRRALLMATAAVARREMMRALGLLGIEAPPVM